MVTQESNDCLVHCIILYSLQGYSKAKAFIIAQSPMEHTARDFWKMIMQYRVSAIVMLCGLEENGEVI